MTSLTGSALFLAPFRAAGSALAAIRACGVCLLLLLAALTGGCSKDYAQLLLAAEAARAKGENAAALIHLKNAVARSPGAMEAHLRLGETHAARGEVKDSERELRIAIALKAPPQQYLPVLGRVLLELERFEPLLDEVKTQDGFEPVTAAAIALVRARALTALGRHAEARDSFGLALAHHEVDARLGLAEIAIAERDLALAAKLIDEILGRWPSHAPAWLAKGNSLRAGAKPEEARAAFDKAIELQPDLVPALLSRSSLDLASGKRDSARALVEQARKVAPGSPTMQFQSAVVSLHERKLDRCRDELRQVFRLIPEHWPSVLLSAALFFATEEIEQAQSALIAYLRRFPGNAYGRKLLAAILLRKGQPQSAAFVLEPILEAIGDDAQLHSLAGQAYLQSGQTEKARIHLEKAVALDPKDAGLRSRLGLSRVAAGDPAGGISDLEAAVDLDAGAGQVETYLIGVLIAQGKADRALEVAQSLEKKLPKKPQTHQLKASAYLAKLDTANARASFEKALQLEPKFFPAAAALAQMDLRSKDPKAARDRLEAFLKKDNHNLDAMLALANLELGAGARDAAARWLQQAAEAHPQSLQAYMMLAQIKLSGGELKGAMAAAERARQISPNEVRVLDLLGRAQMAAGDAMGAVTSYTLLNRASPNSVPALLRLAAAYTAAREYRPAQEIIRKALQLFPKSPDALTALGVVHLETARYQEALDAALQLQKDHPKLAQGYALAGDALMAQKKFAAAAQSFAKADAITSTALLRIKQYQAESRAQQKPASDRGLLDWLEKHPNDIDTRMYLADVYTGTGRRKEGIEQYRKVLQAQPRHARALVNLASSLHEDKDPSALQYAQEAFLVDPSGVAAGTLGWILLGQNKLDEAQFMLAKAVGMLPNEPEVGYHYADALARTGNRAAARQELNRILAGGTVFASASAARKLLERLQE